MILENMTPKERIIEEVNKIPFGKVTSYGAIGKAIGTSGWAVGIVLSGLSEEECQGIAWQRVVAKNGAISSLKLGFRGNVQINILESEGVEVINNSVEPQYFVDYQVNQELL